MNPDVLKLFQTEYALQLEEQLNALRLIFENEKETLQKKIDELETKLRTEKEAREHDSTFTEKYIKAQHDDTIILARALLNFVPNNDSKMCHFCLGDYDYHDGYTIHDPECPIGLAEDILLKRNIRFKKGEYQ